jgi:hypothetical protein
LPSVWGFFAGGHAISFYYQMLQPQVAVEVACSPQQTISSINSSAGSSPSAGLSSEPELPPGELNRPLLQTSVERPRSPVSSQQTVNQPRGVSWKEEYARLTAEIKLRHYSPKTLRSYSQWVRQYQTFTRSHDPKAFTAEHVKQFFTSLAVDRKVSASTQNQAFNALLFFHRHVLNKEFGRVEGVVRAKRKPYIPVVLSRDEIETILSHLSTPYDLVVKLGYSDVRTTMIYTDTVKSATLKEAKSLLDL